MSDFRSGNSRRHSDVMLGIMGQTGTGKSSFVKLVTGDQTIQVGHGVISETSDIRVARTSEAGGRSITFVDTPGFDSSQEGVSDTEVLRKIASYLDTQFQGGKRFNGIIYMHRITDPRMGGISARTLRVFKKLCGSDSLRNVVIVTTRWDKIDPAEGSQREKELMSSPKYFKPLIDAGARFLRHNNTPESAQRIMRNLLDNDPIVLYIQRELAEGKKVEDTDAGKELADEIEALAKNVERMQHEVDEIVAGKKVTGRMTRKA